MLFVFAGIALAASPQTQQQHALTVAKASGSAIAHWPGSCQAVPQTPMRGAASPASFSAQQAHRAARPHRAVRTFRSEYVINGTSYEILGHEPVYGTGHPVYLHAGGGGDKLEDESDPFTAPELTFTYEMAQRGYVAAITALPDGDFLTMTCGHIISGARSVFGWTGPEDESTSAMSMLCRREHANCSAGIAVHGLSIAGTFAATAPRVAPVTGLLVWSSGVMVPHGHGCCGRFSGEMSCCAPGQPLGGALLSCLTDVETSRFIDRRRRRVTLGQGDPLYGEYTCPEYPHVDADGSGVYLHDCMCNTSRPDNARAQCRLSSGYDCGETYDCIQSDGSGYYVATVQQVGGDSDGILQAHNFHLIAGEAADGRPPQHTENYTMNMRFYNSFEPWGLVPQMEWLARIARDPLDEDEEDGSGD